MDKFDSQSAIETLPRLERQAKKFHPELLAVDPFDRAELN
jgi:hypothetical protein